MKLLFDFFATIYLTFLLGIIMSGITYWVTVKRNEFELGYPKVYYYQFYLDSNLHHGADLNNLIFDGFVIWIFVALIWGIIRKRTIK